MELQCPSCNNFVTELVACDSCETVGCIRCVIRTNKQWLCHTCKDKKPEQIEEKNETADLFSMFK